MMIRSDDKGELVSWLENQAHSLEDWGNGEPLFKPLRTLVRMAKLHKNERFFFVFPFLCNSSFLVEHLSKHEGNLLS